MFNNFLLILMILISTTNIIAQQEMSLPDSIPKKVLIVRDSSRLEIAVTRHIKESLGKSGYVVKEVSIYNVNSEKASSYNVSIIFRGMNAGNEINPAIQRFIASKSDTSQKVILYSVYGNTYNSQVKNIDAMTDATVSIRPRLIANQILRSFKK